MALLYDARFRAFDANGDPLAGATLTIYTAGTTTPASIYRDTGLTTPATNPTSGADVSDAGGWFPQLFAAEATLVDIILKDSSGSTVKSYEDVVFLGADTGDFTRTLADLTRIKITGAGGRVLMQVGDASPDNSGGTLTIEGWAGTQADEVLVDSVLLNTTGRIKEIGKKLPSIVYTDLTTQAAAATHVIALPNDPTGVRMYELDIIDLSAAGTTAMTLVASVDSGANYLTGASDYSYAKTINDNTGPGVTFSDDDADTKIDIIYALRTASGRLGRAKILIVTPTDSSSTDSTTFFCQWEALDRTSATRDAFGTTSGKLIGGASRGRVTHVRLAQQGGTNISFKYRLIIHRGTGDA